MNMLLNALLPELILIAAACVLFLLGVIVRPAARRLAAWLALATLLLVFILQLNTPLTAVLADAQGAVRVFEFAHYIKLLTAAIGAVLVLLAWPTTADATGNSALDFGYDGAEFHALILLSLAGVFLVASANDLILLFLAIELAAIPTYILVSISRPLPVAQEAGVKYFFLGAMAAALLLFGFSYLYGTTGLLNLEQITRQLRGAGNTPVILTTWQLLAVLIILAGLSFKMAAVPLHFYAGDVYQGAATPVTALLSFVPKISGFVAAIKILFVISGGQWLAPQPIVRLLWIIAVLTMFVGNVLGLLQFNVKRVLAYSSIAHSGYMLAGLATLAASGNLGALRGVLFYLAAYGIMNAGAFGVLMLLPARHAQLGSSAETFDDLAGQGRQHPVLGLAMAVCCFSLIGLPFTIGFWGKIYLILPALNSGLYALAILMVINAAISAAYYLRIIAAMFLREAPATVPSSSTQTLPLTLAVALSACGTLFFGIFLPATQALTNSATHATALESPQATASR